MAIDILLVFYFLENCFFIRHVQSRYKGYKYLIKQSDTRYNPYNIVRNMY